jgi:peptidoglycan/LPS O-acetylase OafA/YrhL
MAVIGGHYAIWLLPGGSVGVTVFFVLSGFLITCVLLDECDDSGRASLPRFWARRVLRLLPALVLLCLVDVATHLAIGGTRDLGRAWSAVWGPLAYMNNWRFVLGRRYDELTPTWSLAVEEQFYVLWPLILLGLWWLGVRGRRLLVAVTSLAVAAWAWQARYAVTVGGYNRLYYGTDMRAYELLVGCALGCAWRSGLLTAMTTRAVRVPVTAASVVVLLYVATRTRAQVMVTPEGLGVVLAAGWLALVAVEPRGMTQRVLHMKCLQGAGKISYGLYLWNFFLFTTIGWGGASRWLDLALTVAVAVISYRTVEAPFLALKSRLNVPQVPGIGRLTSSTLDAIPRPAPQVSRSAT